MTVANSKTKMPENMVPNSFVFSEINIGTLSSEAQALYDTKLKYFIERLRLNIEDLPEKPFK